MKTKKLRIGVVAVLAVSLLAACTSQQAAPTVLHASYPVGYKTLGELVKTADIAVKGEVVASEPAPEKDGLPFTDATFRVDTWIKGDGKPGDSITVHQTGGTINGQSFVMEYEPLLTPGEQAILYLKRAGDVYYSLGGPTGRLEVKNGKVSKLPGTALREPLPSSVSEVTTKSKSLAN